MKSSFVVFSWAPGKSYNAYRMSEKNATLGSPTSEVSNHETPHFPSPLGEASWSWTHSGFVL
jgi:hypothetical protein